MMKRKILVMAGIVAVLLALALFTTLGIRQLNAAPTLSDIVVTNTAVVNFNSGATAKNTNIQVLTAPVGTNYGVSWIGQASLNLEGGAFTTNDTWLSNDGNATAVFILSAVSNIGYTASKPWTNWFTNVTDGGSYSTALEVTISPAGGKNIWFVIYAPSDETNRAYVTYNCMASNSNAASVLGADATNYTGLNGVAYGGTMGQWNGFPSVAFLTNGEADFTNWRVTVQVADMFVTKTANVSNTGPYAASTTTPYPGALITYRISYTNQGSLNATAVRIVDTLPTNYVAFKTGAMRSGVFGDDFAQYFLGGLAVKTDVEGDDDASTNNAAAEQVVFTPTAGTAPVTGGTVIPDAAGTYFFQVNLK